MEKAFKCIVESHVSREDGVGMDKLCVWKKEPFVLTNCVRLKAERDKY